MKKSLVSLLSAVAVLALMPLAMRAADNADSPKSGSAITVTGEILDMACYIDHGAQGSGHEACARKCITNGLPVGIKTADGQTYLLIGEHMPANDVLAEHAAKTITVHGKFVERDGFKMIENIEIENP